MQVAIYARVSTDRGEQNPMVQVDALRPWLEAAGHEVAHVLVDECSGSKDSRPALDRLTTMIEAGEVKAIAVVKLDRLSRSLLHLVNYGARLRELGVDLMVRDQNIDTSTPQGRLLFGMLGVIAEFERDLIIERTRAGMDHARRAGKHVGRPRRGDLDPSQARLAVEREGSVAAAARALGVPRTTLRAVMAR